MKRSLLLLSACLWCAIGHAQKIEVEKKIRREQFPAVALQWLEKEYPGFRKDRYFQEYGGDTTNYEAKFCWKKEDYSIEFLKDGRLKDVEKQVKFSSVPEAGRKKMEERLDADFKRWKVSRCQEQTRPGHSDKRYEVEIKGRDATGAVLYEYLFEETGAVVRKRQVLLPSHQINQY